MRKPYDHTPESASNLSDSREPTLRWEAAWWRGVTEQVQHGGGVRVEAAPVGSGCGGGGGGAGGVVLGVVAEAELVAERGAGRRLRAHTTRSERSAARARESGPAAGAPPADMSRISALPPDANSGISPSARGMPGWRAVSAGHRCSCGLTAVGDTLSTLRGRVGVRYKAPRADERRPHGERRQ